jgi:hypothetical protein
MISGVKKWLYQDYTKKLPTELIKIFEDDYIPKRWYNQASLIIHRLSEMPWYTQRKLSEETSLTIAELMTLNSFIRESERVEK